MKRVLICAIFLIAFAGITSGGMLLGGFDKNSRLIKNEIDTYMDLSAEEKYEIEENVANIVTNLGKNNVVFDVLLFNFSDKRFKDYFTQSKIDYMNNMFNDDNPNNSFYSIHEYYTDLSYGKVSIYANIYLFNSDKPRSFYDVKNSSILLQEATYRGGMIKAKTCYKNYSSDNPEPLIIFAGEAPSDTDSRLWPHNMGGFAFVSLTYESADLQTLAHEILHTFEIKDYYTYSKTEPTPVNRWDIIASSYYGAVNTFMYNKIRTGWVDVSSYEDSNATKVETITQNGTYTLHPSWYQGDGVLAYKFGVKQNNAQIYFMVEYRKKQRFGMDSGDIPGSGLLIYRVNESRHEYGNLDQTYETYETYVFRPTDSKGNQLLSCDASYYNSGIYEIGNLKNKRYSLYYEDYSICKCVIKNIKINLDGTASFDFENYQNSNVISGRVFDGYKAIPSKVYVNGIYATNTDNDGYFMLNGLNSGEKTLTFSAISGEYTFAPINANPNDLYLEIYPYVEDVKITLQVLGSYNNKEYEVYDMSGLKKVTTLYTNETKMVTLKYGHIYRISGEALETYTFTPTHDTRISLNQTITREQESKEEDLWGKFGRWTSDLGSGIVDGVSSFYNSSIESIQNGVDIVVGAATDAFDGLGRFAQDGLDAIGHLLGL